MKWLAVEVAALVLDYATSTYFWAGMVVGAVLKIVIDGAVS